MFRWYLGTCSNRKVFDLCLWALPMFERYLGTCSDLNEFTYVMVVPRDLKYFRSLLVAGCDFRV